MKTRTRLIMETMKSMSLDQLAKPAGRDKDGLYYSVYEVNDAIVNIISINNSWQNTRILKMTEKMKEAMEVVEDVNKIFNNAITNLTNTETRLSESAKKVSGNVRNAANDLANGLLKIEKTADFNRLERYVELLERASMALTSLAELEKTGKLEKIATAIK